MRWLAITLLIGVFLAHDSANWIAEGTRYYPWAVFFMLQGAWTAVLSVCLLVFVGAAKPDPWRNVALAALAIAILEGLEIPVCGLLVPDFALIPAGVNTCDHVAGFSVTFVTLWLEVGIVGYTVGRIIWKRDED